MIIETSEMNVKILSALRDLGEATASRLSEVTGLSLTTITSRMVAFVKNNAVTFSVAQNEVSNRPARIYRLSQDAVFVIKGKGKAKPKLARGQAEENSKEFFLLFFSAPPSKAGKTYWLSPPGASRRPPQKGRLGGLRR